MLKTSAILETCVDHNGEIALVSSQNGSVSR